ncbi:hypothetical protein ES711_02215 [Gelidibacter salicanalis]|uniref:Uncharacterized protein n=1 Tax=Gelidibacter salicanalis TaxID=291193 RepID=A0A5C7AT16_9FLAO|nr:hypothetical protein [Gelidibacter salicanalis]TXE10743.1 hypothetical protein ES711_02215 [Gelidibacter salicanalis]
MEPEKQKSKGKVVGIVVGLIAFAISYYAVQQFFKPDLEAELKEAAVQLNKQAPLQVDQFVRLDSAASKGTTNFMYYYTLIDIDKSEVNVDTINKYIKPDLIENIKTHPDLKIYRDHNITMEYKYYDKNGEFATAISVTPDLYKSK